MVIFLSVKYTKDEMGSSESKADVLKKVMNNVSVEVMNRTSTSAASSIVQKNKAVFMDQTGVTIRGFEQLNAAKMNVQGLQSAANSGELQSQLTAKISEKVEQEAAALGLSSNSAKIRSVVENNINTKITNETLMKIANDIDQSNEVLFMKNMNIDVVGFKQQNEAESIAKLVNDTNSTIVSQLQATSALEGDMSQKVKGLLPEIGGLVILFLIVIIVAVYMLKDTYKTTVENLSKPVPAALIAGTIVASMYFSSGSDGAAKPAASEESSWWNPFW